jgi:acyl transferase domain-containing protein/acyl-CoA synthetase (AMP-forming)/AMP-acid ligase II/acyl carrier protein
LDSKNFVDILRHRAMDEAGQTAFRYLTDETTDEERLTYQQLDTQAQNIAGKLQSLGCSGERALLMYPPGLAFISAFFGCLYAGVIAVPTYPPSSRKPITKLEDIAQDCQAKVVLTSKSIFSGMEKHFKRSPIFSSKQFFITDDEHGLQHHEWKEISIESDALAFLQYTSGSTGSPKGVMATHENLIHNSALIQQGFGHTINSKGVIWLPPYHDMGLIGGVLQPLYTGFPVLLISPGEFIKHPLRWLKAISDYRATTSGGPNFAYELCIQKIKPEQKQELDLSSWEVAFSGAETVRAETLERFVTAFEPCGFRREAFYPCYGMAETTLMVSGGTCQAEPVLQTVEETALTEHRVVFAEEGRTLVGCGGTFERQQIAIVDPETQLQCTESRVGEIWVSGPSVAKGYWGRPELTEQVFAAYLADSGAGPFIRTGDLGFSQAGELFITGRLKDLVIIRGRNHYPQDIEWTVERSHPHLHINGAAAFSIEVDDEEQLVIVQEVERVHLRKLKAQEVVSAISADVIQQHELQPYAVVLIKPGSLPKTSSGKVRRHLCRSSFLEGTLDIVAQKEIQPATQKRASDGKANILPVDNSSALPQAAIIQSWLIAQIAERMHTSSENIDPRLPFAHYSLDSLATAELSASLEEWLGQRVSPTAIYDYPTVEALALHLSGANPDQNEQTSARETTEVDTDRIAIIGLGCRFPGANNPEAFWELLHQGMDAITEVPASRWDIDSVYDPNPNVSGKMNTRWGGFLEHVDQFDPKFFGISPREAESMDPQQRLLLEVSWEALEQAGQPPDQLTGSKTGVFIGISHSDYSRLQNNSTDAYFGTGNALSIAPNRLSYFLDLKGPSLAVDTACSSSLVGVHQACQSLRQGECQLAIAGGVNLILMPQLTVTFSQSGMMAADGRCKTFDANADGYVRGEGCGVVILKRLSDALRDGDNILALIRGSAINQDGRSNGLTAPNGPSQQEVIRQALENAKVQPSQISYVETHGTGTSLGDPIEVNSLKEVIARDRDLSNQCWIGSVKTNIGHLEAAAGMASLIKVVLSLQHEKIPPHQNLKRLNPLIDIENSPLSVPTAVQPWARNGKQRFAGVSSFGFGGTNAHIVLEEAPTAASVTTATDIDRSQHLLTLSAKSENALQELAQRYETFLTSNIKASLADICFTANTGRTHFNHRLAVTTKSTVQLREQLSLFGSGKKAAGLVNAHIDERNQPKIAFLFTGQGSQYVGMGRQLCETQPSFRKVLDKANQILRPYLQKDLFDILYSAEVNSPLDETAFTQPVLFAFEYALTELWKSWGVEPAVVMGHSIGEYVAACVAGVFSFEDGLKLVAERARLMQALPQDGEMVAVFANEAQVIQVIQSHAYKVSVAAINGPENIVISGSGEAMQNVVSHLEKEGIETKSLNVSHAFHSAQIEQILDAFEQIASRFSFQTPRVPLISNLTGQIFLPNEVPDANYWRQHARRTVRFMAGLDTLIDKGYELFLEIGPKPTLSSLGKRYQKQMNSTWLPSLRQSQGDCQSMLESLGNVYIQGVVIDWTKLSEGFTSQCVSLPNYPFQRERYWFETEAEAQSINKSSPINASTISLAERLRGKNTKELIAELTQIGHFSSEELQLLPKVLTTLTEKAPVAVPENNLFYQMVWQPQPLPTSRVDKISGTWLIFSDQEGLGKALAEQLQQQKEEYLLIYATDAFAHPSFNVWTLNPNNPEDFTRLAKALTGRSLKGVIHLWNLDITPTDADDFLAQEKEQTLGCAGVLHLVQIFTKQLAPKLSRLWLVTRNAISIAGTSDSLAIGQSLAWGIGKVIALEYPEFWGGLIDLDPNKMADEPSVLLNLIAEKTNEDHQALRANQRYVARLLSVHPSESHCHLNIQGTCLITGGFGALGLTMAQWLVAQGAKSLVLTGRRPPSKEALGIITMLEQKGVQIRTTPADVCDVEQMTQILDTIEATMLPLSGIIHAAGVTAYHNLNNLGLHDLNEVLRPKVKGAWVLHQLSENLKLDFFICFSSIASVWGSKGQAHYAAANAFLDALAHYRRRMGLPALSINWGPWAGGGMAQPQMQEVLNKIGVRSLQPEQALEALNLLMQTSWPQATVASVNWDLFKKIYEARGDKPLFSGLGGEDDSTQKQTSRSRIREKLDTVNTQEQKRSLLMEFIQERLARILGLNIKQLNIYQPLILMGFDSLMATEIQNLFMKELNIEFPIQLLFGEGISVDLLVNHLLQKLMIERLTVDITLKSDSNNQAEEITI